MPGRGKRFLSLALTVRNLTPQTQPISWGTFAFALQCTDNEEIPWNEEFLLSSKDELIDQELRPGKQLNTRIFFEVPAASQVRSLYAREGKEGRAYLVELVVAK